MKLLSLTLGIFLSDERACTLNSTCMVDVTDFLSRFICIFLPTSATLSALTASSAVLVNPVEKDTSNCLSRSRSKGLFSSSHLWISSIACVSLHPCIGKVFVGWTMFLDTLFHAVIDIGKVDGGLYPLAY